MADKCIGKLTLDISDVKKKVQQINETLAKAGAGVKVDLSKNISAEVKKQLDNVLKEIEGYEQKISEASTKAANAIGQIGEGKVKDKTLKQAIADMKEYYQLMTKAERARASGNTANYGMFSEQAAQTISRVTLELQKQAEGFNTVKKAAASYMAEINKTSQKEENANLREQAKLQNEIEKAAKARQKAEEALQKAQAKALAKEQANATKQALEDEKNVLDALVGLYEKRAALDIEATKAVASGNTANANLYIAEEDKINAAIAAIAKLYPELDKWAQADDRVAEAELKRQAAVNTAKQKSEDLDFKEREEAINRYADALVSLYNKQTEINNALAKGSLREGTAEYDDAQAALDRCGERAKEAGEKLKQMGVDANEAVSGMDRVQDAAEKLTASEDRLAGADTSNYLGQMKQKYFDLTDAIKNYNTAKKEGDETGMAYAQQRINSIMQEVAGIQDAVNASNVEEGVKQQILNLITQCTTAEKQHAAAINESASKSSELENQIGSLLTRYLSIMAVIRGINSLVQNTVEYVSEYSDKMNEIQIITGKSSAEIDKLGESYRNIAQEMSASSLDMADAAIYFTRQGLGAEEIEKRLRNTTMYAKTANIEFETAAELITAVVNSMNLAEDEAEDGRNAAQRVADVFLKIGDNAATSGKEIGEAMQKAGAAAGAFNMNFEWLASYIATVSETTRQEATSIGTAFNTLIARLHSIRTTGFNSEDETKINDIQKALNNVNVALLDQEGNWRDMTTIFQEVADQWDTLDGKTKSYIATTMAGVKQQNVFLALMEDLSQRTEGTSRAWELHSLAVESAGTASEKYAVYTDSVTAAQERLNVAQEKFYSLLDDSVIKGWYDGLAGVVNMIADGAKQFGVLNVAIPAVTVGVGAFIVALKLMNTQLGITNVWVTLLEKHPIMMAIGAAALALGGLVTIITSVANGIESAEERISRLNTTISNSQERAASYLSMQSEFGEMMDELASSGGDANDVLNNHTGLLNKLSTLSPTARDAVNDLKSGFDEQTGAVEKLNAELDKYIKAEQMVQATSMMSKLNTETEESVSTKAAKVFLDKQLDGHLFDDTNFTDLEAVGLPLEFIDHVAETFDTYVESGMERNSDTLYRAGAETMAYFFKGMTAEDYLKQEANEAIDSVVAIIGMSMDGVEKSVVKDQLAAIIFGDDGILSADEYNNMQVRITEYMSKAIAAGFDADKLISESELKAKVAEIKDEIIGEIMDFSGVEGLGHEMWNELDIETLRTVQNLIKMGATISEIESMMSQSESVEEFAQTVIEVGKSAEEAGGLVEESATSIEEYTKKMKATQKDIDSLDEAIKTLESGGAIDFDDLMDLTKAHPEIMGVIGDIDALKAKLIELRGTGKGNLHDTAEEMLLGMDIKNTPFADFASDEVKTLHDYIKTLDEGTEEFDEATDWLENATDDMADAAEKLEAASEAWLKTQANTARSNAANNWAKSNNYIQQITGLQDALQTGGIKAAIELWSTYDSTMQQSIAQTYPNLVAAISDANDAIQNADAETLKKSEENAARRKELVQEMADLVGQTNVDLANRPLIDSSKMQASGWDVEDGSISTLFSSGYSGSIGPLEMQREVEITLTPITPDGEVLTPEELDAYVDELLEDAMDESDLYERDKARKNLLIGVDVDGQKLHELQEEFYITEDAADSTAEATENLGKQLNKASKYATSKYFKNTAKAIKDLEEGTISAADAYDIFYKECDKVTKAYDEIGKAQVKMDAGTQLVESDVNSLADALGISAEKVIDDFPGAVKMFEELRKAGQDAFNDLNKEATMKILGISEADFSAITNGLVAVQSDAKATIDMLIATGQWELVTEDLPADMPVFDVVNGKPSQIGTVKATGHQTILKAKGNNPYASRGGGGSSTDSGTSGGGGGGGGGGSSNSNSMTEVERALDRMSQVNDIQGAQQSFYQAQNKYYSQTGQSQGVIAYTQKEIDVLEAQNKTLKDNVAQIEAYMAAKQKELASMSTSDERYEEVADDLDKLQKAHQQYTQQLIDNKTSVDALNKAIEEQHKKIRQMEIDLRNLVAGAIRDREEKATDMLENEIEMENTILDLITKRYEKERDEILDTNQRKIDALEQEKDLLSQQLELRKQMADEEDKLAELAELEAQYQRISADPTRRKEALDIQKKIADLRDEIAWDTAEKEVEAQQESLDQQITSLEDYAEYVEEYYEDLFEHPKKLIDEMRTILAQSDAEILAWLKANDEEYANSSDNRRKQIEEGWKDTLMAMRGEIETYWDEVEKIIAQGDDAIIQFLKDNSKEYAEAGKLQAEAYVDEWKKQLEDLHKAYESVNAETASDYQVIDKSEGSGGSGGGGGGGSGGNGGNTSSKNSSGGSWDVAWSASKNEYVAIAKEGGKFSSEEAAKTAASLKNTEARTVLENAKKAYSNANSLSTNTLPSGIFRPGVDTTKRGNLLAYAKGGIADFTGPAWLDGTKSSPERILSPYQTQLFEAMVDALESMSHISIPTMPNLSGLDLGGSNPVSVGDIIVNVDNLDTDDDYEDLAQKVSEILMERIGRTAVVGGLRINSF